MSKGVHEDYRLMGDRGIRGTKLGTGMWNSRYGIEAF
jgi:hypothetical protein